MGDGLESLDVNNSRSMGTIGVCLSSFEYTWSLPFSKYIQVLNCKFLMWNVSLNIWILELNSFNYGWSLILVHRGWHDI
jgi:hypothetical protein